MDELEQVLSELGGNAEQVPAPQPAETETPTDKQENPAQRGRREAEEKRYKEFAQVVATETETRIRAELDVRLAAEKEMRESTQNQLNAVLAQIGQANHSKSDAAAPPSFDINSLVSTLGEEGTKAYLGQLENLRVQTMADTKRLIEESINPLVSGLNGMKKSQASLVMPEIPDEFKSEFTKERPETGGLSYVDVLKFLVDKGDIQGARSAFNAQLSNLKASNPTPPIAGSPPINNSSPSVTSATVNTQETYSLSALENLLTEVSMKYKPHQPEYLSETDKIRKVIQLAREQGKLST
jgi:hypothetical protein